MLRSGVLAILGGLAFLPSVGVAQDACVTIDSGYRAAHFQAVSARLDFRTARSAPQQSVALQMVAAAQGSVSHFIALAAMNGCKLRPARIVGGVVSEKEDGVCALVVQQGAKIMEEPLCAHIAKAIQELAAPTK